MADKKITQLTNITGANLVDADEFVVVDISADETKAITLGELKEAFDSGSGFVRITGDTMTGDLALSGADVTFGDNDKAIFGAGSDLQIYHNGSNSYIDDAGTGSLWVRGNDVILGKYTGEYYLYANADGALNLYYDGTKKLNTTSTGVDITGTLSSDGLTVDGSGVEVISVNSTQNGAQINFDSASTSVDWSIGVSNSADGDFLIYQSGSGSGDINLYTGGLKRQEINRNGDISFYEDTGTTAKFFWDASAEGLNIGAISVPFGKLDISNVGGSGSATIFDTGANGDNYFTAGTSGVQVFRNGSTERMRITSSGRVGIGTSSPNTSLDVSTSSSTVATFRVPSGGGANNKRLEVATGGDRVIFKAYTDSDSSAAAIAFNNGASSEAMRITSSGSVGIGTSSPARGLHVNNNGESFIRITSSDTGNAGIEFGDQSDGVQGAIFQNSTDNSLRFNGYNNSEAMRIDSSGNVGIGTGSPDDKLHVTDNIRIEAAFPTLRFKETDTTDQNYQIRLETGSLRFQTNNDAFGAASERMRIDSSGNVGIATTDPVESFSVGATQSSAGFSLGAADTQVFLRYNNYFSGTSQVSDATKGSASISLGRSSDGVITFNTAAAGAGTPSEAARIDSSGNLLVGKTTTNYNLTGVQAFNMGYLHATADISSGGQVVNINRKTSDGELINLRKDGATVGSIGVESSAAYFAGVTYGIKPYSAGVAASNSSGVFADGTADLGKDNIRWKDLYLSGGVYLGGTGAANKLDDYEEGTWTPTAIGTSGEATLSEASGSYTKVGRMVTVNAEIDVSSVNTASGIVRFGGLPFTVANIISPTSIEASGSVSYWAGFTSAVNSLTVYADDSSTILDLTGNTSATATAVTSIGWTNMGTGEVRFSLTYFTT